MNDQKFQEKFDAILAKIDTVPEKHRERLRTLAEETQTRHHNLKKSFSRMRESLADLQLRLTYLIFDLEATKRERNHPNQ